MAKLCMGCMNPLPEGNVVCSICGFDPERDKNPDYCLQVATQLQGHYIVGRFISAYSDHLLYLGYDRQLREPCFIQEFFPEGICRRDTIGGVQPLMGRDFTYEEYANQFRETMRNLARVRDLPALVPVYDIFEEGGTVYAASDYCQGMSLTKKIKMSGGRLTWAEAQPLFMPLLSTLAQLNENGIHHLAVSPDNIIIGADGKARLRNFSVPAAHQMGTQLSPLLESGFAAPEQYHPEAMVDERTDVYGIAATLFRTVTGNDLPVGSERAKNSDDLFMSADVARELTQPVCAALFNALLVQPEKRTAAVATLRDQLSTTPNVAALVDEAEADMNGTGEEEEVVNHRVRNMLIVFSSCLVGLLLLVGAFLYLTPTGREWLGLDKEDKVDVEVAAPEEGETSDTDDSEEKGEPVEIPNFVDQNYFDLIADEEATGGMVLERVEMREDDSVPDGTILEQTPVAGTPLAPGSTVQVVISVNSDQNVKVPDVYGMEEEKAKDYLEAKGFRVTVEEVVSNEQPKGFAVGTDPRAGSQMRRDSVVTLFVSKTEPTTTTTTKPTTTTTESTTTTTESTTTTTTTQTTTTTTTQPTETTATTAAPTDSTVQPSDSTMQPNDTTAPSESDAQATDSMAEPSETESEAPQATEMAAAE